MSEILNMLKKNGSTQVLMSNQHNVNCAGNCNCGGGGSTSNCTHCNCTHCR